MDRAGVPTVAGFLLFGNAPEARLPDARISAVRFSGTEITANFADRKEFGGRLLDQIALAESFLENSVPAPSSVEGWNRVERGIPIPALREALVNAIIHRDYRVASQTRLMIFSDRIEIINPGVLLNMLSLDSIRFGGISQRRNPVLASLVSRSAHR